MPVLPVSVIEPIWDQFALLLPDHPEVDPSHPLGCHRRRVSDRVVFDHVVAALVHGSGDERIATPDRGRWRAVTPSIVESRGRNGRP